MGARWRAVVVATVLAVSATGALAATVRADPPPDPAMRTVAGPSAVGGVGPAQPLASVTGHPVDPAVLAAFAAPRGSAQTVTETIQLSVRGGDIELPSRHASVALRPVPGSDGDWTGELPPVRVVDARGTHEGWSVRWALAAVDVEGTSRGEAMARARMRVAPDEPIVVDGLPVGLAAGDAAPSVPHGRILFAAARGTGGGTYEAGATVSLRLPRSIAATEVTVELTFSLG